MFGQKYDPPDVFRVPRPVGAEDWNNDMVTFRRCKFFRRLLISM